jgi:hypothetical protein
MAKIACVPVGICSLQYRILEKADVDLKESENEDESQKIVEFMSEEQGKA